MKYHVPANTTAYRLATSSKKYERFVTSKAVTMDESDLARKKRIRRWMYFVLPKTAAPYIRFAVDQKFVQRIP